MIENNPAGFIIIQYNQEWFNKNPEYIGPFGHLCREHTKKGKNILLISQDYDKVLSELELMADKMAFTQDLIMSPNMIRCDISQGTLEKTQVTEGVTRVPIRLYGQQALEM